MHKDIQGYEGLYQISNQGKVFSLKRNKYLKYKLNYNGGYPTVVLYKDKQIKTVHIHRLVALYFIDNPNNYKYVNHIDGNKENNDVSNLEWCTGSENMIKSYINGSHSKHRKEVEQIDMSTNQVIKIWESAHQIYNSGFKAIYDVLYKRKNRKSSGGFYWRYKDGQDSSFQ